ncbi:MAG: carbohydrate binding domain-containing protein [Deltaproteobacteria bacterium]
MLTRGARLGQRRDTQTCSVVLLSFVLGSGCALDDLSRLGAGRAAISVGADATAPDAQLADRLRPDHSVNADAGVSANDADAASPAPELLPNPSFEAGHEGWLGFGDSRIFDVVDAHTGDRAILSTNRQHSWEGPSYDIASLVTASKPYAISAWVRNEFDAHNIMLTLKVTCAGDTTYTRLATRAVADDWLQLDASFLAPDCADLEELSVYVEGPPAYRNVLVDDVSLRSISLPSSG